MKYDKSPNSYCILKVMVYSICNSNLFVVFIVSESFLITLLYAPWLFLELLTGEGFGTSSY